jgi:hypothetical protein
MRKAEAVRVTSELNVRSLPSLAAATIESLSFFARVSGFMAPRVQSVNWLFSVS